MRKRLRKKKYIKAVEEFSIWWGKYVTPAEAKTLYPKHKTVSRVSYK